MDIQNIIREKLNEIEKLENIKILHAVESGSRAWGFASPDSDFDVRFVYAHPKEFYLRLNKTRDVIEWQLDETFDINGWDLDKTLRLLYASNPTVFEWANSPIIYATAPEWACIKSEMQRYFAIKSSAYHYFHTASKTYKNHFRRKTVRLKRYFYVLRPLLACEWVLRKKTPPPMLFSELAESRIDKEIKSAADDLLTLKKQTSELGESAHIAKLDEYIEKNLATLEPEIASLPFEHKPGWEALNKLFVKIL
jgi:predicted nucleotidyltransferase